MSLSDDLYKETILDHYQHPRNQGVIGEPTTTVEGVNPLCGDELTLYLQVEDGKIADVKLKSKGCSINTASGSMMTEAIHGHSLEEVKKMVDNFKNMMLQGQSENVALPEEMEDLEALRGVKKYPVRIKCALLPWNTLLEGIKNVSDSAKNTKIKYEVTEG